MTQKRRIMYAVFFACGVYASPAWAMTLAACKARALHNSRLLESYTNAITASLYAYRKDLLALLPHVSAEYEPQYLHFGDRSDFTHGDQSRVGVTASYEVQRLLVNYPQLSHLELQKSRLVKAVAEDTLQQDLAQKYYQLFVFLKEKQYYADAQSFIKAHVRNLEELQVKGVDVKLDLIRANVQLTSLDTSLSDLASEIEDALIALNSMMNTAYTETDFASMDAPDITAITTDQEADNEKPSESSPHDSYLERVERLVPGALAQLERSKLEALDVKIAKASHQRTTWYFLPSVHGGFERNIRPIDPNVEETRAFLALNVDVMDWAQKAAEERQSHYSYEAQQKLFEENQRELTVHIQQLISQLEKDQTGYRNALENEKGAEHALATAKEYFQQGKIKETDLLSVFSEYLAARDRSVELLEAFLLKKVELDALLAGLE